VAWLALREPEYDNQPASPRWGIRKPSEIIASTQERNPTLSLSLILRLRVNNGTDFAGYGGALGFGLTYRNHLDVITVQQSPRLIPIKTNADAAVAAFYADNGADFRSEPWAASCAKFTHFKTSADCESYHDPCPICSLGCWRSSGQFPTVRRYSTSLSRRTQVRVANGVDGR
jgi:hypothetical protein